MVGPCARDSIPRLEERVTTPEVDTENLPREIGRAKIELAPGVTIEVVNLDNGMRVITEESMESFLNWLEAGNTIEGKTI